MTRIYLDHNATSPLRTEARAAMRSVLDAPAGNPSSVHEFGHRAKMTIESARSEVARLLGADPEEIVLTGGGTEGNNLAIFGAVGGAPREGRRLVTSAFEHPSVMEVMDDLEERGYDVVRVRPARSGLVEAEALLDKAGPGTVLVSLMLANNEVGTLQPVRDIAPALRSRGILLHCDAAQAVGKVPVDVGELGVDLLSVAAHKFGGPAGVGALYVRRGCRMRPHLRGGGQELNRRPGTENVAAIAGMGAAAAAIRSTLTEETRRLRELRDRLEGELVRRGLSARINGAGSPRVPNTSSIAIDGATGEGLVIALDLEGVAVSAGAACSAGTIRQSPSLLAMGCEAESTSSIRVSLGHTTTAGEIDHFVGILQSIIQRRSGAVRPRRVEVRS